MPNKTVMAWPGAGGQQYHIYIVNGVQIFAKGANWVPPDSLEARVTDQVLCGLLASAKAANMNFLRIWGGGIYPQDGFFDCADELVRTPPSMQELCYAHVHPTTRGAATEPHARTHAIHASTHACV